MKRIAIPVVKGVLSAHFGHCEYFAMFDVEDHTITNENKEIPPPHQPGVLPKWLAEKGATDIIAGGMGQRAIQLFHQNNINVCIGAETKKPKELAEEYISGKLVSGENLCDH